MGIGIQETKAPRATPTLTPAVRDFLDGLAEIIARDILRHQTGDTETQDEPDRVTLRGASSC